MEESGIEKIRKATWLELFFDLIFVVAISKTAHARIHIHNGQIEPLTYFKYFLIMVPVWWAWIGHTMFADRFSCEDPLQRVMTLLQMFCAIVMSVYISLDFDGSYRGFMFSYMGIRLLTVLMYMRAGYEYPELKTITTYIGGIFAFGALISLCSIFFHGLERYIVLYAGITFELVAPVFGRSRLASIPVDRHHLPERFGLMTIILLGESVLSLVHSFEEIGNWTSLGVVAGACGFVMICALWWIYFENLERHITGKNLKHGQQVVYPHFLIYLSLGGIAAMIRFAAIPDLNLFDYKILSTLSVVIFMVTLQFLCFLYHPKQWKKRLVYRAAGFHAAFLIVVILSNTPLTLISCTAILLIFYAAFTRVPE